MLKKSTSNFVVFEFGTMSGNVRVRKQWQLQDGPNGTLRRLRNQLADDGDVESQLVIAKQLLEEAQVGGDWTEQTARAVYWLTRAAEYGNGEAGVLLRHCYRSGTGITKENWASVRHCIGMTEDERQLRTAARDLFASLTPFGQDYVTTHELRARLQLLDSDNCNDGGRTPDARDSFSSGSSAEHRLTYAGDTSKEDSPDSTFSKWYRDSGIFDGQCLTEARLLEAASRVARGQVPEVSLLDEEAESGCARSGQTDTGQLTRFRLLHKLRRSCAERPTLALDTTARWGETVLRELLTWDWTRTLLIVLLVNILWLDAATLLLPAATFYASLALMTLSTVQLLRHSRGLRTVDRWVRLFRTAHSQMDAGRVQRTFHRRRLLRCYARFFGATLLAMLVYPQLDVRLLRRGDVVTLAAGFTVACLVGVDRQRWRLLSLLVLLLTTWLSRVRLWPFVDSHTTHLIDLSANFSLVWSARHAWPALVSLAHLSWSARRLGVYGAVLPDVVALVWCQLSCTVLVDAGVDWRWTDLVPGGLAWALVLALPVCVALLLVALGMFALYAGVLVVARSELRPYLAGLCVVVVLGTFWCRRRPVVEVDKDGGGRWRRVARRVPVLAVGFAAILLAAIILRDSVPVVTSSEAEQPVEGAEMRLGWDTYHRMCHQPARHKVSPAVLAEKCARLAGATVHWRGQVRDVAIVATVNRVEDMLQHLPNFVVGPLRCLLGARYDSCDGGATTSEEEGGVDDGVDDDSFAFWSCKAFSALSGQCHLRDFDRHQIEVTVRIRGDGYWNAVTNVLVRADDAFRALLLSLVAGDEVSFVGELLRAEVGVARPAVRLRSIVCEDCATSREVATASGVVGGRVAVDGRGYSEALARSVGFVAEQLFHPFLRYRTTVSG